MSRRVRVGMGVAAVAGVVAVLLWPRTGGQPRVVRTVTASSASRSSSEAAHTESPCMPRSQVENLHRLHGGGISVIATGAPGAPPTVTARLYAGHTAAPPMPVGTIDAYIAVVRRYLVDVPSARGVSFKPMDQAKLLSAGNIVAKGTVAHVADYTERKLILHLPRGLPSRDYFAISDEKYAVPCGKGELGGLLGLVRISPRPPARTANPSG